MKVKSLWCLALSCLLAPSLAHANLMITLVVDGTLTHPVTGGGSPKFVELFALADIPNLSVYAISRGGNGLDFDALTPDFVLPAVSVSAGSFFYAAGSPFQDFTIPFEEMYPSLDAVRNFGVNSNGDDVTGLFISPSGDFGNGDQVLVDVFGELLVDGTGTPWQHEDGYALSKNDRLPSTVFDVNEWIVTTQNLDGLSLTDLAAAIPVGVFGIPEPTSIGLALLALAGVASMRRSG